MWVDDLGQVCFIKSLLNFFAIHALFYVLIFGQEVRRILPWMEPVFPALGDEILTTGPPGKSQDFLLISGFEQFDCDVLWYSFPHFLVLDIPRIPWVSKL